MYKLFITNKNYSSWSLRPWLLMRALSIPFQERLVPLEPGSCWETFRVFSPNGRVPCLHDGARTVWDSLAIVEYLAERHAGVWPLDDERRAWARSVASEMHSGFSALRGQCSMNCGLRALLHEVGQALRADVARIDEIWTEGRLRFGGPYLAGSELTAADAFFAPVVFRMQSYGLSLTDTATAYAEFLVDHPAMREWYAAALDEPWRDAAHEAEVAAVATILADYRIPET